MKEANKEITLLVELAEIVILFDKMQQENISVMNKNDGFLDAGAQSIILSNKREAKKMEAHYVASNKEAYNAIEQEITGYQNVALATRRIAGRRGRPKY